MNEHKPVRSFTVYDYGEGYATFEYATKANEMHSVIWEFLNDVLRPVWKHGQDPVESAHYEKLKDELYNLLRESGINHLF
jgi:hypothetical protein